MTIGNRSAVLDGLALIKAAGKRTDVSEAMWHQLLADVPDDRLYKAFALAAREFKYRDIDPSRLRAFMEERMNEQNYHGAGNQEMLPLKGWQMWKDDAGREYAYHPSMPGYAKARPRPAEGEIQ